MALKRHDEDKRRTAYHEVNNYIQRLSSARSLDEVFNLHKELWKKGIHHRNFGPDKMGMFRCDDINAMTMDHVYLGNVHGIWTNTMRFFKDGYEKRGDVDTDVYMTVLNQYKNHMVSNLKFIESLFYDCGVNVVSLGKFIEDRINEKSSLGHHISVDVKHGINAGELKDITLRVRGSEYTSSILVLLENDKPRIFMPSTEYWRRDSNYLPPHVSSKSEIKDFKWTDIKENRIYSIEPTLFNKFKISSEYRETVTVTESAKSQKDAQQKRYMNFIKM